MLVTRQIVDEDVELKKYVENEHLPKCGVHD
jgi:hypothetical protein